MTLADAGAFADYVKAELVEGVIVAMNARYSRHAHMKGLLYRRLADAVEKLMPDHHVWSEVSVRLSPDTMLAPDIIVTSFRPAPRAPVPGETVRLAVEVADTTLADDLGRKPRLYAAAGVPEYWVLDVEGKSRLNLARIVLQLFNRIVPDFQ